MATRGARNKAADAARRLLEDRVTLVADLAEAGTAIDRTEAALLDAQNALSAARGEYRQRYRTALDGGWTDTQLTDVDCPAARGRDTLGQRGRGHKSPPPRTAPTETAEPEPADQDPEHVRATDDDSKAAQASPDAPAPAA